MLNKEMISILLQDIANPLKKIRSMLRIWKLHRGMSKKTSWSLYPHVIVMQKPFWLMGRSSDEKIPPSEKRNLWMFRPTDWQTDHDGWTDHLTKRLTCCIYCIYCPPPLYLTPPSFFSLPSSACVNMERLTIFVVFQFSSFTKSEFTQKALKLSLKSVAVPCSQLLYVHQRYEKEKLINQCFFISTMYVYKCSRQS